MQEFIQDALFHNPTHPEIEARKGQASEYDFVMQNNGMLGFAPETPEADNVPDDLVEAVAKRRKMLQLFARQSRNYAASPDKSEYTDEKNIPLYLEKVQKVAEYTVKQAEVAFDIKPPVAVENGVKFGFTIDQLGKETSMIAFDEDKGEVSQVMLEIPSATDFRTFQARKKQFPNVKNWVAPQPRITAFQYSSKGLEYGTFNFGDISPEMADKIGGELVLVALGNEKPSFIEDYAESLITAFPAISARLHDPRYATPIRAVTSKIQYVHIGDAERLPRLDRSGKPQFASFDPPEKRLKSFEWGQTEDL